ncbi:MAG: hypothetical protein WD079_06930 [Phycisphaeraceae bacterium]
MQNFRFHIHNVSQDPRFAGFSRTWAAQPSWVWRLAIVAGLLFVVLPIVAVVLVLGLAFALTFGLVFGVLAMANRLGRLVGNVGRGFQRTDGDGRRNVRVIRHDEPR